MLCHVCCSKQKPTCMIHHWCDHVHCQSIFKPTVGLYMFNPEYSFHTIIGSHVFCCQKPRRPCMWTRQLRFAAAKTILQSLESYIHVSIYYIMVATFTIVCPCILILYKNYRISTITRWIQARSSPPSLFKTSFPSAPVQVVYSIYGKQYNHTHNTS